MKLALCSVILSACISSSSVVCMDGTVCPATTQCDEVHHECVTVGQLDACKGLADLAVCTLPLESGNCQQGVCLPIRCGNARLDVGEACDDGNTAARDGCAADCTSNEKCGNGFVDLLFSEACDDGNLVEHDGCSSACQRELANWSPLASPPPRELMAATYDARLQHIVMLDGFGTDAQGNFSVFNDMWTWRSVWKQARPALGPQPRTEFGLAYDAALQRTILFGGESTTTFGDTWSWDGTSWTRLADGPPLVGPAMVYDARRKKIVLFGGFAVAEESNTWEFDGTAWTKITTAHVPPARYYAAMTYDPERDMVVMFGGNGSTAGPVALNDLWEYDGTDWHSIVAAGAPPPLQRGAMAFDRTLHKSVLVPGCDASGLTPIGGALAYLWNGAAWSTISTNPITARCGHMLVEDGRGGLVLFGGTGAGGVRPTDTWRLDGATWIVQQPPPRNFGVSAHDLDRNTVVVFGGSAFGSTLNDTWELSEVGWRSFAAAGLVGAAMTYDVDRHEVVRFGGGVNPGAFSNGTFAWTGAVWVARAPTTIPTARIYATLVHDADTHTSVLFGGTGSTGSLQDTWLWNGVTWTQAQPASSPPKRYRAAAGYDPVHRTVVVFGGTDGAVRDDTWLWDGTTWTEAPIAATARPVARAEATMTWNPARQRLVLAGGLDVLLDAWEWDGAAWSPILTSTNPPPRLSGTSYPTLDGSGIALAFGQTSNGILLSSYQLSFDSAHASDGCAVPADLDGDGLLGCSDPDCWMVCTPECLPGTSCLATAPHCGDGVCSPIESCHTCAADCACTPVCGDFVCDPGEVGCSGDCG